jgi:hypothetical protein
MNLVSRNLYLCAEIHLLCGGFLPKNAVASTAMKPADYRHYQDDHHYQKGLKSYVMGCGNEGN